MNTGAIWGWIGILGALTVPTRTLAIALSICGGIALVLALLYRSLENRNRLLLQRRERSAINDIV